jgi:hypothetical protein
MLALPPRHQYSANPAAQISRSKDGQQINSDQNSDAYEGEDWKIRHSYLAAGGIELAKPPLYDG